MKFEISEIKKLQKIAGILKEDDEIDLDFNPLSNKSRSQVQLDQREEVENILRDNYSISDAVQEFLGWEEEEAEWADVSDWDDVIDKIMSDPELLAGFIEDNLEEDFKWTSTRTDTYDKPKEPKPQIPSNKSPQANTSFWQDYRVKNRLGNTRNQVIQAARSLFRNYDYYKKNYEKKGEAYNLEVLKKDLVRSIENNIQEYFFDKLKRKHNITIPNREQYFQGIPAMVEELLNKLPNDPTEEQLWYLWLTEFSFRLKEMFKQYEKLGK